jgi:hypothetical protein
MSTDAQLLEYIYFVFISWAMIFRTLNQNFTLFILVKNKKLEYFDFEHP